MNVNYIKNYIKETFTYYITKWWAGSFFYLDIVLPARRFENAVKWSETKEEAIHHSKIRYYRWLPKSYKKRVINEKFC